MAKLADHCRRRHRPRRRGAPCGRPWGHRRRRRAIVAMQASVFGPIRRWLDDLRRLASPYVDLWFAAGDR